MAPISPGPGERESSIMTDTSPRRLPRPPSPLPWLRSPRSSGAGDATADPGDTVLSTSTMRISPGSPAIRASGSAAVLARRAGARHGRSPSSRATGFPEYDEEMLDVWSESAPWAAPASVAAPTQASLEVRRTPGRTEPELRTMRESGRRPGPSAAPSERSAVSVAMAPASTVGHGVDLYFGTPARSGAGQAEAEAAGERIDGDGSDVSLDELISSADPAAGGSGPGEGPAQTRRRPKLALVQVGGSYSERRRTRRSEREAAREAGDEQVVLEEGGESEESAAAARGSDEQVWEEWDSEGGYAPLEADGGSGAEPEAGGAGRLQGRDASGSPAPGDSPVPGGGGRRRASVGSLGEALRRGLLADVRPRLWTDGSYADWGWALGNYSKRVGRFGAPLAALDYWVHVRLPHKTERRVRRCVSGREAARLAEWWARRDLLPGVAIGAVASFGAVASLNNRCTPPPGPAPPHHAPPRPRRPPRPARAGNAAVSAWERRGAARLAITRPRAQGDARRQERAGGLGGGGGAGGGRRRRGAGCGDRRSRCPLRIRAGNRRGLAVAPPAPSARELALGVVAHRAGPRPRRGSDQHPCCYRSREILVALARPARSAHPARCWRARPGGSSLSRPSARAVWLTIVRARRVAR
jgi:hypothetical protein